MLAVALALPKKVSQAGPSENRQEARRKEKGALIEG